MRNFARKNEREKAEVAKKVLELHLQFGMDVLLDLTGGSYRDKFNELNMEWMRYCTHKNGQLEAIQLDPRHFYQNYEPIERFAQLGWMQKLCKICAPEWVLETMDNLLCMHEPRVDE